MGDSCSVRGRVSGRRGQVFERSVRLSLRQSPVQSRHANFQTPENRGVQRPSDYLDLGAHHAVVVFLGVHVEIRTFLGCHVAVGEASIIRAD